MIELWTILIAVVTAAACALAGSFLVLRREALVSEADLSYWDQLSDT